MVKDNYFKRVIDKFETDEAKKRRSFLEFLYLHKDEARLYSAIDIGKELQYDPNKSEHIAEYWLEKGFVKGDSCLVLNAKVDRINGIVGPGEDYMVYYIKINQEGIDEVEKHWLKKFVDRNKDLITIVISFVSLAISIAAFCVSLIIKNKP
jgi:hypothetical protein